MSDGRGVFILRESSVKAAFNTHCELLGEGFIRSGSRGCSSIARI